MSTFFVLILREKNISFFLKRLVESESNGPPMCSQQGYQPLGYQQPVDQQQGYQQPAPPPPLGPGGWPGGINQWQQSPIVGQPLQQEPTPICSNQPVACNVFNVPVPATTMEQQPPPVIGVPVPHHNVATDKMPEPHPDATFCRSDVCGKPLYNIVATNIELEGCELRDVHCTGTYIRNCNIYGGAFSECSFKSSNLHNVRICIEGRFDDATVDAGSILTKCKLKRSKTAGATLNNCKS